MPSLGQVKEALFFAVLSLVAVIGWQRTGDPLPLVATLGFTLAGSWLAYRGRLFGQPTLIATADGVRYRRGRKEVRADWTEVEAITFGAYLRDELWIVRRGGPPIKFNSSMTSADGERFDMLIEEYWSAPPEARSRRSCG